MTNQNKREKLTSGKCDLCEREAQIPWKTYKFCYWCWNSFWKQLTMAKGVYNEPQATETREEEIQNSIKQKEKNGVRRPGKNYVNFNF